MCERVRFLQIQLHNYYDIVHKNINVNSYKQKWKNALRCNLRTSIFDFFSRGHASRLPSRRMLCMLSMLCTLSVTSPWSWTPQTFSSSQLQKQLCTHSAASYYMYKHTHIHTHTHTHVHTYTHTRTHTETYAHTYTHCVHTYVV